MIDLDTPVDGITFVAFDFETTGLYPATDRIVEFGAVRFRLGQELDTFSALVNPGCRIHPAAAGVSGIGDADVADKPPVAEMLPRFVQFLGDDVLLAHNARFDGAFLRAELERAAMATIRNPISDTQVLAQRAFPGRPSYALQALVEFLQIPTGRAHRAEDDARRCMRLFAHCVDAIAFMGDLPLRDVLTS